jgi:hypothetical protein
MAGGVGIEPTQEVLETPVLPLYEPPIKSLGIIGLNFKQINSYQIDRIFVFTWVFLYNTLNH